MARLGSRAPSTPTPNGRTCRAKHTRPLGITFNATLGKVREGDSWACDGTHKVPVTAAVRHAIGKSDRTPSPFISPSG